MLYNTILGSSRGDRRNQTVREALVQRVHAEFAEMPGMRLTAAQARRLFALPLVIALSQHLRLPSVPTRWMAAPVRSASPDAEPDAPVPDRS